MIIPFGYIGLALLVISFTLLLTKYSKYFLIADIIATFFLLIHAIIIKDTPFILGNIMIIAILATKQAKGGIE